MTIKELLPQLHHLSKSEKLTVIKFLVQELESESEDLTPSESIFLSSQDWEMVTNLISNPPSPTTALLSAIDRYKQEVTIQ
jgi:uncharacterized protein (DUF1778 family)